MKMIDDLKQYITLALVRAYGQQNRKNIERYLDRKIRLVLKDVLAIALSSVEHKYYASDDTVKLFLSTTHRKRWGQMTLNGKQVDAPGLLAPILFYVVRAGHTQIGSAVKIRDKTMDALMEYAIEENDELQWKQTFDFSGMQVMETAVNVQSLRAYVAKLASDTTLLTDKKLKNLSIAKTILASVTAVPGKMLYGKQQPDVFILTQEASIAASGRCYLKGLNLQNCPKEVRHAALGHCHLYDMRAGVFGVMAGLAKTYYESSTGKAIDFHKIKNYINNRDKIRKQITNQLWPVETKGFKGIADYKGFHGFYKVKVALTAIGFGAKRNATASWKNADGKWEATSLRRTFKSTELVQQFVQVEAVKQLMDEFKMVTDIILLQLKQDSDFASAFEIEGLKDSQKLAMVYQGVESAILDEFTQLLMNTGSDVLLPVHDGVYVSKKIALPDLHFKLTVPFISDKSYIQFDHSQIGLAMPVNFEAEHRRDIAAQERDAQAYRPMPGTVSASPFVQPKPQVMTQWGLVDAELMPVKVGPKKKVQIDYDM